MNADVPDVDISCVGDAAGLSSSWPGDHPTLSEMAKVHAQVSAAARGTPASSISLGACWSSLAPAASAGQAAQGTDLAGSVSIEAPGVKLRQEPCHPMAIAVACTSNAGEAASSGGQTGSQSPGSSGKSGSGREKSGLSLNMRSASAPLNALSKSVKETHAERKPAGAAALPPSARGCVFGRTCLLAAQNVRK